MIPNFLFQKKPGFSYISHFSVRTKRIIFTSGTLIVQMPQDIQLIFFKNLLLRKFWILFYIRHSMEYLSQYSITHSIEVL